jgi:DNA-binding NarL/FixJ family response regulator
LAEAEQVHVAPHSDGLRLHRTTVELRPWPTRLSSRDVTVLRLLSNGCSTADIADDLAYSESTIKNIIHDLVSQLGARNRAHAVAMAIRAGVI